MKFVVKKYKKNLKKIKNKNIEENELKAISNIAVIVASKRKLKFFSFEKIFHLITLCCTMIFRTLRFNFFFFFTRTFVDFSLCNFCSTKGIEQMLNFTLLTLSTPYVAGALIENDENKKRCKTKFTKVFIQFTKIL